MPRALLAMFAELDAIGSGIEGLEALRPLRSTQHAASTLG